MMSASRDILRTAIDQAKLSFAEIAAARTSCDAAHVVALVIDVDQVDPLGTVLSRSVSLFARAVLLKEDPEGSAILADLDLAGRAGRLPLLAYFHEPATGMRIALMLGVGAEVAHG